MRQPQYSNSANRNTSIFSNQQPPNVDISALVKVVVNDMTLAENGGQWKLSCYGPFSEKPAFPNFQDYSFEEIRSWFYDARKNNQLQQFQSEWMRLLNEANMRINALKNPSQEIINTIVALYNAKTQPMENLSGKSAFSFTLQANQPQVFNQNQFGNKPSGSSPFHQQSGSIFAQPQTSLLNNQQSVVSTNQNIFANNFPQQNQPNTTSIFSQNQHHSNSIFNTQPQTAQNQSNTVFTSQNQPNSNSIFSNQAQIAQNQSNSQSIFHNQQQNPANSPSVFNNQMPNAQIDTGIYSKLEDLTESEIKWFQSDDLTIDKIPEKPPTFEMCFKT